MGRALRDRLGCHRHVRHPLADYALRAGDPQGPAISRGVIHAEAARLKQALVAWSRSWAVVGQSLVRPGRKRSNCRTRGDPAAHIYAIGILGHGRTRWAGLHTDEVYFRDTAHGFLAWAVATLLTAALLTSAVSSILRVGAKAGAAVVGGAASAATAASAAGMPAAANAAEESKASSDPMSYFVDSLFRRDASQSANPTGAASSSASSDSKQDAMAINNAEVSRIFMNSLLAGSLPPEDAAYRSSHRTAHRTEPTGCTEAGDRHVRQNASRYRCCKDKSPASS